MKDNGYKDHDVELYNFYSPLQTRDDTSRTSFLENLDKTLKSLADASKTAEGEENGLYTLKKHLPVILRLSYDVPFPDVREYCTRILQELEDKGVGVPRTRYAGPTSFISSKELVPVDTDDEETFIHFSDAFLYSGRVTNIKRLMSFHLPYLDAFMRTESYLMQGEGPLPFDWRYYIGILAAARHQCSYLVNICETEFLLQNGDPDWLKSIDHAPKKLKNLMDVNKILAHRPWLITVEHLLGLLKGPSLETWSVAELVHAIVILVHFHGVAGLVYGCGVNPEIDLEGGHTFITPSISDSSSNAEPTTPTSNALNCFTDLQKLENNTQTLLQRMKQVEKEHEQEEEASHEEVLRQFRSVESGELALAKEETVVPEVAPNLDRYRKDRSFRYEDFAKRDRDSGMNPFRAQDFSWHKHGFSLVDRLYPNIGGLLDAKFNAIVSLTYKTMGDETDVDTTTFRLATWNYIHLVFGIFHDDYRYDEVNRLLYRAYKEYVKMVACFPEKVTQLDYLNFLDLRHSEKVHINLLILESRLQAELLYFLRTLSTYMKNAEVFCGNAHYIASLTVCLLDEIVGQKRNFLRNFGQSNFNMILYASLTSPEVKAIRFYIDVNSINCCFYDLDTGNKQESIQNVLKKNPSGIVPFLEDSDVLVLGSVPILLYLAEKFGKFALFGRTPEARAKVESIIFWALNSLSRAVYFDFAAPRLHESYSIGEFEDISLVAHGKSEIINHFESIEKHYLKNHSTKYLISNELTMADVYIALIITPLESVMFDFTPWPFLCKWFELTKADIFKASQKTRLSRMTSNNNIKSN